MDFVQETREKLEQLYSDWMFEKYTGLRDKHQITCMIEDSLADWYEFLESDEFFNYIKGVSDEK